MAFGALLSASRLLLTPFRQTGWQDALLGHGIEQAFLVPPLSFIPASFRARWVTFPFPPPASAILLEQSFIFVNADPVIALFFPLAFHLPFSPPLF